MIRNRALQIRPSVRIDNPVDREANAHFGVLDTEDPAFM